jgi:predicted nucleic acid-binding protein
VENKRMNTLLCDTNIFIEIYRKNISIRKELEDRGLDNIAISDVTRAELFVGAKNKIELQAIHKHLNTFQTLHILPEISENAVELLFQYHLSYGLDFHDALIATTAIYYNVELFTLNIKDFIFLPNIKLYHMVV